jgi:flavin-dependent dehydrogenase
MPDIIGGSLAGASAALELLKLGQPVTIYEKSKFPRHKVCGEFLDAAAVSLLGDFKIDGTPITETALIWPDTRTRFELPKPALGISRHRLDQILIMQAQREGAILREEIGKPHNQAIIAHGRKPVSERGQRLFGYKAHFAGPTNNAVELYFNGVGYTGVNPIEDGLTNVCGIAREEDLKAARFDGDEFVARQPHLAERLAGRSRQMEWLFTGPLFYGPTESTAGYPCGDALSFVDPFTGSGMLCAIATGQLAARSIVEGLDPDQYIEKARTLLLPAFRWSSLIRRSLSWPLVPYLAQVIPGRILYRFSRPSIEVGR